ncbi:MAG TPA: hypothetical protein DC000_05065 [Clostridiales bacterium]|nr:hypothetical protein [Clostridiales bacterium]
MIKYYFFCIRWMWKNRHWKNTRQKFNAMNKAYKSKKVKIKETTHAKYIIHRECLKNKVCNKCGFYSKYRKECILSISPEYWNLQEDVYNE